MSYLQKIINANEYSSGSALTSVAGARALTSLSRVGGNHSTDASSTDKIEGLSDRYDDVSYYNGRGVSSGVVEAPPQYNEVKSEAGTAYTLQIDDSGAYIRFTSSDSVTVTIPEQSSVTWEDDIEIIVEQAGTGTVTINGEAGVTIQAPSSLSTSEQYEFIVLKRVSSDVWNVFSANDTTVANLDQINFSTGTDIGEDIEDGDRIAIGNDSDSDASHYSEMGRVKRYVKKQSTSSYSANQTLTVEECHGFVVYATANATLTLPPVTNGMNVVVITIGNVTASISPDAGDRIWLDGIELDDGDKITNLSTAGDIAVMTYYSADGWHASTNSWTDGGA